jgi:DNA-binding GntR family transcriptional regulator
MTVHQPLTRPASLKDAAYRQIKALLLAGALEQDRLYSAQFFADQLGVSRTPAREALLQLAGDGVLVCHDVRGFQIKHFSDQEIRDVFETRTLIETHALRKLAAEANPADLVDLQKSLKAMTAAAQRQDAQAFVEADKEFHMVALRRCGNAHLLAIMENIRTHISIFALQALRHAGRFDEVLREHAAIVKALRRRDRKQAFEALRHHLATTERYLLSSGNGLKD